METPSAGSLPALILFAHGSRDPEWMQSFHLIAQKVAELRPDVVVHLAFLEMMQPTLPEVIDRLVSSGHTRFTVAPLFMAQGAHLKRDLSEILGTLRSRHPRAEITLLPAAGEAECVRNAIGSWAASHV